MDHSVGMARWRRVVLALVMLASVAAVALATRQATEQADEHQEILATEAAVLIEGTAAASLTAMAGGGGLVTPTGEVDLLSFRTYAGEVIDVSPLQALAFEPVVPLDERPSFEAELGSPIVDQRDGALVVAGDRPVYYPVRELVPRGEQTLAPLGYDLLADPVRGPAAIAARDSARTVLTEPVRGVETGRVSYFLVKPLYRADQPIDTVAQRQAAHAGFLSTLYAGRNFADLLAEEVPSGTRFTLQDGDVELAGTEGQPRSGATREVQAGDRTWTLTVEDGRGVDRSPILVVAAFAALLLGGLVVFFRRTARHEADMRRAAATIASTADLAQALAAAGSVEEVELVIRHQLPGVVGAKGASLGVVDRDREVLRVSTSPAIDASVTARWTDIPLDRQVPIVEVVHTGDRLLLRDLDDWRAHSAPEVVRDVVEAGIVSTACLPLTDRHGQVAATLAILWAGEIDFDAPTLDTLRTITELSEYTLDRARSTDEASRAASKLAQLAAHLASAVTVGEVLAIITRSASSPVGASATSVGLIDREAGTLRTHHGEEVQDDVRRTFTDPPLEAPLAFTDAARTGLMVLLRDHAAFSERYPDSAASTSSLGFGARAALPMRDSEGTVIGSIVHAWAGPRVFDETLVSTLLTIADMAAQALERANLAETEHRLVTALQGSLLVPLPAAAHLDIAARYLPAVAVIGMGGDWYEGIAIDDHRYALILGDVAGHGITAVGDMAQLRAVVGALVRMGTPLPEVFSQATVLLQATDHQPTASSLVVIIDTEQGLLSYAAAGHPPPIVLGPEGGVTSLDDGRQPILGVAVGGGASAQHPFPPGSALVAYTDGLIERRGEPIDVSLEQLAQHVGTAPSGADASGIAEHLLDECILGRDPDDDVALVVICHVPPAQRRPSSTSASTSSP